MPDRKRRAEEPSGEHAPKLCVRCGRSIAYRKKFVRSWDEVKFCSDACRTHKPLTQDHALEEAILLLLKVRGRDKTICPSEAARAVSVDGWEGLMQTARSAARRLAAAGKIDITQHGQVVDGSTAKGAIRLRLR